MRFYLCLTLPLILFLTPLHSLDSETNSPTYKFTIVSGAPTTLNASDFLEVASFEECTEKCQKDQQCIMAYQANSSDPCYLFAWNSIQEVARNESGGVGTVAFKVYTNQPSCDLNAQFLMNGKIYPISPNDTMNYLWKIDTSEDGWKITYIQQREEDNIICGNFSYNRPYEDGCNPECMLTFVQLNGEPGPLSYNPNTFPASSWQECRDTCFNNRECWIPYWQEGVSENCTWYKIDDIWFINKTEASEGKRIGLKLPLSNRSCKLTTDELLNDQYYYINKKIGWAFASSFLRVRTTPKYYKFQFYVDENATLVRAIPGCEVNTVGSKMELDLTDPTVCMRLQKAPGITYNAAKEICNEWDGKLMPERHSGFLQVCLDTWTHAMMPFTWSNPYPKWGFPEWKEKNTKIWMGIEKDQASGQFKWLAPEWLITNGQIVKTCARFDASDWITFRSHKVDMTWGPNQPVMKPGLDCAYTLKVAKDSYPGYGHYTATCDAEPADGFLCGTPRQKDKGIPKYQTILDEYESQRQHEQQQTNESRQTRYSDVGRYELGSFNDAESVEFRKRSVGSVSDETIKRWTDFQTEMREQCSLRKVSKEEIDEKLKTFPKKKWEFEEEIDDYPQYSQQYDRSKYKFVRTVENENDSQSSSSSAKHDDDDCQIINVTSRSASEDKENSPTKVTPKTPEKVTSSSPQKENSPPKITPKTPEKEPTPLVTPPPSSPSKIVSPECILHKYGHCFSPKTCPFAHGVVQAVRRKQTVATGWKRKLPNVPICLGYFNFQCWNFDCEMRHIVYPSDDI
ncbi:hypothetical protein CAEBREN_22929 [Caenorhabditis brenneri]|uniref:PAN-3 domain-containing protein n=1 Tax=Caenorhabditis brenneri TaxID=135651 RepID=G0P6I3_CAEBE|nr:hypothetical protein CAEBREN_22929 [Caenorhabditis brenneri]